VETSWRVIFHGKGISPESWCDLFFVKIRWGSGQTREENPDTVSTYEFGTEAERDAFTLGVDEASGWLDYEVVEDDERRHPRVSVTLTAANMGDVTEQDFDAWASWVASHVDEACNVDATIDQFRFIGGPDADYIEGGSEETRASVKSWLSNEGWVEWCASGALNALSRPSSRGES
jgi:hypothetical protein